MIYLDQATATWQQGEDVLSYKRQKEIIEYGVSSASVLVDEFEEKVADYLGVTKSRVLATNSGTSALHLSLIGAGVKPGDNVVLPVLTYAATVNAIKYVGANPVFTDVCEDTWLMDIDTELMDGDIYKYVMPVDLYGNVFCDSIVSDLLEDGSRAKLILDACESFGAESSLESISNRDFYCYSFNGNKIITTGAGGLIVHQDKETISKLKRLSMQGRIDNYQFTGLYFDVGYNYRMAGINASLGIKQLKSMGHFLKRKRAIYDIYKNELSGKLKFQSISPLSNHWMTAALFPYELHEAMGIPSIMSWLKTKDIPSRRVFRPLNHSQPFKDGKRYPVADMIYDRGLCLPSSVINTDEDIMHVCKTLKEIL